MFLSLFMIDAQGRFHGTDWLRLETAIEIIGDMIAYYCSVELRSGKTKKEIAEYEMQIYLLGQERQRCYSYGENKEVIDKAYNVYGPFLKALMNEKKL